MQCDVKLGRLRAILRKMDSVIVAFSAGVDSTFLAAVAQETLGESAMAVTVVSPFVPVSEAAGAAALARSIGIKHLMLKFSPPGVCRKNGLQRCYYCKKALFLRMLLVAKKHGFKKVVEGTNLDDNNDFRPGARALKEVRIISPLRDAGFTKHDIRRASRNMGLSTWNKESAPCLATRIPYGQVITPAKLSMVEQAEKYLRALGFTSVRVRHYGDTARIEVIKRQIPRLIIKRKNIVRNLKLFGFTFVTADLSGYRPGSMNEVI